MVISRVEPDFATSSGSGFGVGESASSCYRLQPQRCVVASHRPNLFGRDTSGEYSSPAAFGCLVSRHRIGLWWSRRRVATAGNDAPTAKPCLAARSLSGYSIRPRYDRTSASRVFDSNGGTPSGSAMARPSRTPEIAGCRSPDPIESLRRLSR